MIQPKTTGSFLELDDQGHVVKRASHAIIQPEWKPLLREVISAYRRFFGPNLHSIWLRGSVAKGQAEAGLADLDTFSYIRTACHDLEPFNKSIEYLEPKYSFCAGIEWTAHPVDGLQQNLVWRRIIKTQAICLYGEDVSGSIPPYSLRDMIHYSRYIRFNLETKLPQFLQEDAGNPKGLRMDCAWSTKMLLRSLFETVMLEEDRWTNDLWLCYERYAFHHPEREPQVMNLLQLSLNPTADEERLKAALSAFIPWHYEEIKARLGIESDGTY